MSTTLRPIGPGDSWVLDDATGAIVGVRNATGNPLVPFLDPAEVAATQALVSGAWNRVPSLAQSMAVVGDSYAFQSSVGVGPGLTLVFTRTANIVTVTGATSHGLHSGSIISALNFADPANEVQRVRVLSVPSTSSLTYRHEGPDGVMAQSSAGSIINHGAYQSIGFFAHFNRLTSGAYRLVANAGFPGQSSVYAAGKVATWVAPYSPQRVFWFAGYNDLTAGLTVAQTVAAIKSAVDAYPSALWDVFSTSPFNTGSANNTAANLRQLSRYYPALKAAFSGYANVRVHDSMALFGLSTGLAKTNYIGSDNIHPIQRWMYEAAKYIVALDAKVQTPAMLPTTTLDTIALDATSKGAFSNPLYQTPITATAPTTGNMPTGCTMQITPALAVAAASSLVSRSDGFGNDWQIVMTPDVATTLTCFHSLTTSYFTSGGMIDSIVARVSITGLVTGKVLRAQVGFVWITDEGTYTGSVQEASGSAATVSDNQQDDVSDWVFCIRDVPIPTFASPSLARMDFSVAFAAAGASTTIKIGRVQVYLA